MIAGTTPMLTGRSRDRCITALRASRCGFCTLPWTREYRGTELEDRLIRTALSDAHRRRLPVLPFCHQVRKRVFAHPVYLQLVPAEDRQRFRESFEENMKEEARRGDRTKRAARKTAGLAPAREGAAA